MRVIFMGTPQFSVPVLNEIIAAGHDIVAVYSQPPRPRGRGQKLQPSPVNAFAQSHGLPVRTPLNFKDENDVAAFAALDADIAVVVAYGLLLPQAILDAPALGCINLHTSQLPRWRGAAPIQRAIMAGDQTTAVQIMQMEKGLDTGPILLSEIVEITDHETGDSLTDKLSYIGADMMPRILAALSRGGVVPTTQSQDGVTYAKKFDSAEARIDWSKTATEIDCHIRGLSSIPGAWFEMELDGNLIRIKTFMSSLGAACPDAKIGEIIATTDGIDIACGDGNAVRLLTIQKAGKPKQDHATFTQSNNIVVGGCVV